MMTDILAELPQNLRAAPVDQVEGLTEDLMTAFPGISKYPEVLRAAVRQRVIQQLIVDSVPVADIDERGTHVQRYSRDAQGNISELYYASYGSNLYASRFMVYLRGGTLPGNSRVYSGANDPALPTDDVAFALPGAQFFCGDSRAWSGGVAFLDTTQRHTRSLGRGYRITADQFNDVIAQENGGTAGESAIDITRVVNSSTGALNTGGVYGTLTHVGDYRGCPVVTFTGPFTCADATRNIFTVTAAGELVPRPSSDSSPSGWDVFLNSPSRAYRHMIAQGIRETHPFLTEELAHAYIQAAEYVRQ